MNLLDDEDIDNPKLDRQDAFYKYLAPKMAPDTPEELNSRENLYRRADSANEQASQRNLMSGLLSASAKFGSLGGKYQEPDTRALLASGQQASQRAGQFEEMAQKDIDSRRKERQSAIGQYLINKKQDDRYASQFDLKKQSDKERIEAAAKEKKEQRDFMAREKALDRGAADTRQQNAIAAQSQRTSANPKDTQFLALPKPSQEVVKNLSTKNANMASIANLLDADLDKFKKAYQSGNEGLAINIGQNMVKTLNSPLGADAVGSEESKRLANFLEFKMANVTGPGSFIGRDLDQYTQQVADKSNAIKATIKANQKIVDDLYAGRGMNLEPTSGDLPEQRSGEAIAAPADPDIAKRPLQEMTPAEKQAELDKINSLLGQ